MSENSKQTNLNCEEKNQLIHQLIGRLNRKKWLVCRLNYTTNVKTPINVLNIAKHGRFPLHIRIFEFEIIFLQISVEETLHFDEKIFQMCKKKVYKYSCIVEFKIPFNLYV